MLPRKVDREDGNGRLSTMMFKHIHTCLQTGVYERTLALRRGTVSHYKEGCREQRQGLRTRFGAKV